MKSWSERILILCKTYPSPSSKYSETSCVAGLTESGHLIRLFPVPFRLINDNQQFKKWQWIKGRVGKAPADHRAESHKLLVDTIVFDGDPIPTNRGWELRRAQLARIHVFGAFETVEQARQQEGVTLAVLRPQSVVALEITPVANNQWTEEELAKLLQHQTQAGLFDDTDQKAVNTLRKLPFDFHYRYTCQAPGGGEKQYRHKIVDWEVGALYWNCRRKYKAQWEAPFRKKLAEELPAADLMFLMGLSIAFPISG